MPWEMQDGQMRFVGLPAAQLYGGVPENPTATALGPQTYDNSFSGFQQGYNQGLGLDPNNPSFLQELAAVGPEDEGKSHARLFGEQFLGNLGTSVLYPLKKATEFSQWLGSPFSVNPPEGPTSVEGNLTPKPFGAQPQPGRGIGGGSLDIPLGAQPQMPTMPGLVQPDTQRIFAALSGLGPSGDIPPIEVARQSAPVAPDTAPLERTIQSLQANAPQAQERNWFEKYGPGIIAGLAGAATGGIGGALLGGVFHLRNIKQMAEQDERYRQAKQANELAVFQAQSQLAQLNQAYQQALVDTQDTNEGRRVDAVNRTNELRRAQSEAEKQWQIKILELQMEQDRALADATNRYNLGVMQQQMQKYQLDLRNSQPNISGGVMSYQTRDAQGNPVMRVHQLGGRGAGAVGALGKLDKDLILPETLKQIQNQTNWDLNYQMGNPWGASEVVVNSAFDRLPEIVPGYEDLAAQVNERLSQQGIYAGSKDYPQAFEDAMKVEVLQSMIPQSEQVNPDIYRLFSPYTPYADLFLQSIGVE